MATVYKVTEWQGGGKDGYWYCEHTSSYPVGVEKWVCPSRILGITPADFIKFIMKEYNAEIFGRADGSFVGWRWKNYADCHRYVLFINRKAREKGFQI